MQNRSSETPPCTPSLLPSGPSMSAGALLSDEKHARRTFGCCLNAGLIRTRSTCCGQMLLHSRGLRKEGQGEATNRPHVEADAGGRLRRRETWLHRSLRLRGDVYHRTWQIRREVGGSGRHWRRLIRSTKRRRFRVARFSRHSRTLCRPGNSTTFDSHRETRQCCL